MATTKDNLKEAFSGESQANQKYRAFAKNRITSYNVCYTKLLRPEQLWDTTMNPENRTLVQVKIDDVEITDDMFTTLMGDKVEPRRDFIQNHALEVADLDI